MLRRSIRTPRKIYFVFTLKIQNVYLNNGLSLNINNFNSIIFREQQRRDLVTA